MSGREKPAETDVRATPPRRPLDVLYLRDHLIRAGGTTYLLQTLPRFDPSRVRPRLCVLGPRNADLGPLERGSVPTTFIERRDRDPRRLRDLWRVCRSPRPDLMLLSGPRSTLQGRLIARPIGKVPTLARINYDPGRVEGAMLRMSVGARHRVLTVSKAVARRLVQSFGVPKDWVHVVYNGLDLERFAHPPAGTRDRVRKQFTMENGTSVIGLIGRIDLTQKGQDVLIRSLPLVLQEHPDVLLLIVGDGPDHHRCRDLARNLGVLEAVYFTGHRDDIPEILASIDLAVVPSVCEEGLANVALEAQAAGRPVVVSRSGGLPEAIVDRESGLVVPKGDPEALAAAIIRLLDDPALAARFGECGRQRAQRFTLDHHIEEVTQLYERVARPC